MNQVSGQFQQFADPVTIKLQRLSRFGVRRRVISDSGFRVGKPINLWKANLHCLSELIKRYLQKFQVRSNS